MPHYFAKTPRLGGETPTPAMASANRLAQLTPKLIEGIKDVSQFVKQELTNPTNDSLKIVRLEGDYKGLAMISPINNPLQDVLVDALAHVIGLPETPSMRALRYAMHATGQSSHKERKLLSYLKNNGIQGAEMMTCMRALRHVRHLIPNHGHLGCIKANQTGRQGHMMMTPH